MSNIETKTTDDATLKAFDIAQFVMKWFFKTLLTNTTYFQLKFFLSDKDSKNAFLALLNPVELFFKRLPKESRKDRSEVVRQFYKEVLGIDISVNWYYGAGRELRNFYTGGFHSLMYCSGEVTPALLVKKLEEGPGLYLDNQGNAVPAIKVRASRNYWFAYHDEIYTLDEPWDKEDFFKLRNIMAFDEWALVVLFNWYVNKSVWDKATGLGEETLVPSSEDDHMYKCYYNDGKYKVRLAKYGSFTYSTVRKVRRS